MKLIKRSYIILPLIILPLILLAACSKVSNEEAINEGTTKETSKDTIIFADAGWDSLRFHNSVAGIIIRNGLGYKTESTPGTTPITVLGLRKGQIDVHMELWQNTITEQYDEGIKNGEILEVSTNFDDNAMGLYVPTYVIKGDKERGIEPMAPDLKTIQDLKKYPDLFKDPEDKTKGRIYNAPSVWEMNEVITAKVKNYGLSKYYNVFDPGSDSSLSTSLVSAFKMGEPWVGYYWEPTWITGMYDMTLLEEPEYSEEKWNNGYLCEFKPVDVTVCVNADLVNTAPDVVEFLKNYKTSSAITAKALSYMKENNVDEKAAAKWFIKEHEKIWTKWVSEEVAEKVKSAVK
ncbi:ABC transporter substrate-binding protein [Maledivibacter halophilus]|uniref:Glycine betaine/proline transport system substrate-binding protein n=1 Tax=Maledivibacter halophilus TaxID=36842 RepID=A0A1T5J4D2_9FIRM|nr:ABC transporter substrate-binding protein [Maledivibacter halophilus]SKC46270.1 glycine betaine/proline transport system substrate-binding protein [Maledivibacter halophilus]